MQRAMYHAGTSAVRATTTAEDDRSEPAATVGQPRAAGGETAKPSPNGRPAGSAEQMRYVFHELHADYRHALCEVCEN
jgi:hypothetical protein